jgi:hypothetical protein
MRQFRRVVGWGFRPASVVFSQEPATAENRKDMFRGFAKFGLGNGIHFIATTA